MRRICLLGLMLVAVRCGAQPSEVAAVDFDATGCFGTCPIFDMTIWGDGTAHYVADGYNERTETCKGMIGKAEMDSLSMLI